MASLRREELLHLWLLQEQIKTRAERTSMPEASRAFIIHRANETQALVERVVGQITVADALSGSLPAEERQPHGPSSSGGSA